MERQYRSEIPQGDPARQRGRKVTERSEVRTYMLPCNMVLECLAVSGGGGMVKTWRLANKLNID
jgi:hypothetical protein